MENCRSIPYFTKSNPIDFSFIKFEFKFSQFMEYKHLFVFTQLLFHVLNSHKIKLVQELENLTRLIFLMLQSNQLQSVQGLEKLETLHYLFLSSVRKDSLDSGKLSLNS